MDLIRLNRLTQDQMWEIVKSMSREEFGCAMQGVDDVIRHKFFQVISKEMKSIILEDYTIDPETYQQEEIQKSTQKLLSLAGILLDS